METVACIAAEEAAVGTMDVTIAVGGSVLAARSAMACQSAARRMCGGSGGARNLGGTRPSCAINLLTRDGDGVGSVLVVSLSLGTRVGNRLLMLC